MTGGNRSSSSQWERALQLGDALKQHLGWDVPVDARGGDDRGESGTEGKGVGGRGGGKGGEGAGGGKGGAGMGYGVAGLGRARGSVAASDCSDVHEFVKRMRPLLDLGKDAEVALAEEAAPCAHWRQHKPMGACCATCAAKRPQQASWARPSSPSCLTRLGKAPSREQQLPGRTPDRSY
ncbi:unnamed protein product [Closterium sp. Naga37s-1]|nr:unnamed protein product [Closterium sp. Naga37s-1]